MIEEKLKKPACSKWNELAKIKPEIFQYVLVNTQYCRYPAQVAMWNGIRFKSTDNGNYLNITHWAEINDLRQKISRFIETDKIKLIQLSIDHLEKSFDVVRGLEFENENISEYYDQIGLQVSNISGALDILSKAVGGKE